MIVVLLKFLQVGKKTSPQRDDKSCAADVLTLDDHRFIDRVGEHSSCQASAWPLSVLVLLTLLTLSHWKTAGGNCFASSMVLHESGTAPALHHEQPAESQSFWSLMESQSVFAALGQPMPRTSQHHTDFSWLQRSRVKQLNSFVGAAAFAARSSEITSIL
eukprot:CAMPEP_0206159376 /NCGR_PEP_ID=MMETSP1474-20131121/5755_1 /ASSEMBLY_ACC=CAM_ASM_001110 /TAXON_ID=97495 /ORGANISM="Imantonia sp., Strain RCC918" /LENGTH=159 /DNA_ID=CAMNT_0053560037 /DNA_START=221 /DNA_END=701 /DNA_ORIENTATION=-